MGHALATLWTDTEPNIIGGLVVAAFGVVSGYAVRGMIRYSRLKDDVDELKTDVRWIKHEVKKQSPNGRDTNNSGDLIYRIAEKLGAVVPDIPHEGH